MKGYVAGKGRCVEGGTIYFNIVGGGIDMQYPPPTLIILHVDLVHHFINATSITTNTDI
jgi:hypothetical protein